MGEGELTLEETEKTWDEFWALLGRVEERNMIPSIEQYDQKMIDFVIHVCDLEKGSRILDLGCGGGNQSILLAKAGFDVIGIDIAQSLINHARMELQQQALPVNFECGDMRELGYVQEFDACLVLGSTFGFFSDQENQKILDCIAKSLKPGGKAFVSFTGAIELTKPIRSWSELESGWILTDGWYDSEASSYFTRSIFIGKDGIVVRPKKEDGYHADEQIRCYSVPELRKMLDLSGMKYLNSYSSSHLSVPLVKLHPSSIRNIILAERV